MIIILIILLFGIFNSGNKDDHSYMSDKYNEDSTYRRNVDKLADDFNTSTEDVDAKINAASDAVNGN